MKAKLERLRRIERLQMRLRELSLWRLGTVARRRDSLQNAHTQMLAALGDDSLAFIGPIAAAASRRLRALEMEIATARDLYEAQARVAREQGAKARVIERAAGEASAQLRADRERKSLSESIDRTLQAKSSVWRKP